MKSSLLRICIFSILAFALLNLGLTDQFDLLAEDAETSDAVTAEIEELIDIETAAAEAENKCPNAPYTQQCPKKIKKFHTCCLEEEECGQTPGNPRDRPPVPSLPFCYRECGNCSGRAPNCCGSNDHCIAADEKCCVNADNNYDHRCPFGNFCCGSVDPKVKGSGCYAPFMGDICCSNKKACKGRTNKCCDSGGDIECISSDDQCCGKKIGDTGKSSCKKGQQCCSEGGDHWCCKDPGPCGSAALHCKTTTTTTSSTTTPSTSTTRPTTTNPTTSSSSSTTTTRPTSTNPTTSSSTTTTRPTTTSSSVTTTTRPQAGS